MRHLVPLLLPLVLTAGCNNNGLKVLRIPPSVVITDPVDESIFENGEPIFFEGMVQDDSDPDELVVEWISSLDGIIEDTDPPDPDGRVEVTTSNLSPGTHVITLRAIDPSNEQDEDEVVVNIEEVPELPSIVVDHPTTGENGLEDSAFVFQATVGDHRDPPEALVAEVSSTPGGLVCELIVDGDGNASCPGILPLGEYMLTFLVTDLDGNQAQALAAYAVVSPDDYDYDGDGYSVNGGDCNDSNETIYPGAPEICDGLDNDCTEATGIDVGSECYDDDGDGYCEVPPCLNTTNTLPDCDDNSATVSPVAVEVLNGIDDDCDGFVDEGTAVYDDDGDGYCESPPCVNASGTIPDCNDGDYAISPGATEICSDGVDQNCDGILNEENAIGCHSFYYDADGDAYGVAGATECWCDTGGYPYTGTTANDCYDSNANANPAATGYFTAHRGDGSYDFNCSGSEEQQYSGVSGGCDWDITYLSCDVNGAGWENSVPSCGSSGYWIGDCDATYDPICYALCLLSSDPFACLLSTCSATCDEDYSSFAQGCR
jgi:hypothetical protein